MANTHSIDSLRQLNAKLLAEIAELRKENAAIPDPKRKRDAENAELKTKIEELEKNKADSSAENVMRDDAIVKLKAEIVKLRNDNEGSNQVTFSLSCSSGSTSEFSVSKIVKKLQDQQQDKEVQSHKKKEVENIVQAVFDFTIDESDKNHMAKFSLTRNRKKNSVVLKNIARLYEDAMQKMKR
ncbi:hypothetical protein GLOIN_2v1788264 [Rhizophagus clarus]|uniref:Uncharacterized protein n=1 Tax=Rhizophagus clarus TaxID=94130 RepID=A0A8H3KXQ1_9GLOM|nr:hypothetical protein GLOIN_2v1788264 [Rhizophagus clarus]